MIQTYTHFQGEQMEDSDNKELFYQYRLYLDQENMLTSKQKKSSKLGKNENQSLSIPLLDGSSWVIIPLLDGSGNNNNTEHCVKSVQIRSYFWFVFSCIRIEYGDLRNPNTGKHGPKITPYLDTFHAVLVTEIRIIKRIFNTASSFNKF